ncbi:hypothetical protein HMP0015_2349, partial [Acinetobacter haemolyticus ATCC 19194]
MGFIVKLLDSGNYFTAGEDGIDTTLSREKAIANGQFTHYEEEKETAETWSGQMALGEDYTI